MLADSSGSPHVSRRGGQQGMLLALLLLLPAAAYGILAPDDTCSSEAQMIQCGLIPPEAAADRSACCALYATIAQSMLFHMPAASAVSKAQAVRGAHGPAAVAGDPAAGIDLLLPSNATDARAGGTNQSNSSPVVDARPPRPDLLALTNTEQGNSSGVLLPVAAAKFAELAAQDCVQTTLVNIPRFSPNDTSTEQINAHVQAVPVLSQVLIRRIKASALSALQVDPATRPTWEAARRWRSTSPQGFSHPGGTAGAGELALMQRLREGSAIQSTARHSLLTGSGTPVKIYAGPRANWSALAVDAVGTSQHYGGPFPMAVFLAGYGGINDAAAGAKCAASFPADAPQALCGHIALVELDGAESYKQALAYVATGVERHAEQALDILDAWASTNRVFGHVEGNGALEAAWACSSMSRAMELLVTSSSSNSSWVGVSEASYERFVGWVKDVLMPVMDAWIATKTPPPTWPDDGNMLANWHASISDCWMTFAVLSNDRPRYQKAVELFTATVRGYFKWGRGRYSTNRIIGESTETLRDVYHTLFGLGSLLLAAETAWQAGDEDLYSSHQHVLAAAMELHAAIVNAGRNESLLPLGFKLFESMPPPPDGCSWRINLGGSQSWVAVNQTTGTVVATLRPEDGHKYVLGNGFLPTGWEAGFNHFSGRLGLHLPQSATLLRANWPEHNTFCWGLTTLTHADTAALLWQAGITEQAVCGRADDGGGGSAGSSLPQGGSDAAAAHGNEEGFSDLMDAEAILGVSGLADGLLEPGGSGLLVGDGGSFD